MAMSCFLPSRRRNRASIRDERAGRGEVEKVSDGLAAGESVSRARTILEQLFAGLVHEGVKLDLVARRLVLEVGDGEDLLEVANAEVADADAFGASRVLDGLKGLPGFLNGWVSGLGEVVWPVDEVEIDVGETQLLERLVKRRGDVLETWATLGRH